MSLLKVVATVAVVVVLLFDAGAVLVNHVQVDEAAQTALRAAAQQASSPEGRRPQAVEEAARAGLSRHERARLDAAVLDDSGLTVTVSQDAPVLVLDRLGPLADLATAQTTKRAELTR